MSGPDLPNPSLLSAIDRLKAGTAKLPLSTPEGSIHGTGWKNFSDSPHNATGAIFEKIGQAYTRCFSRLPSSSVDPLDNILRGSYGMDVVIRFFEECARSPKLDSSASHLTELKVGQLTNLVYARINSLPKDPPDTSSKKKRRRGNNNRQLQAIRSLPQLVKRGHELLEYLYELYKLEMTPGQFEVHPTRRSHTSTHNLGWIDGLLDLTDETNDSTFPEEIRNYLDGKYRYKGGNILVWWKENESHIPVLSRIA